jgi:peptide/nickel transport system substrate-binding protein
MPLRSWILVALLAATGCQKARPQPAGSSIVQPGGELVFALDGAGVVQFNLDPHKSAYAPHNRVLRSIFDSLVVALPEHKLGPWLAESWIISPDRLTYTFKLRSDVQFHDGTALDAEAVKYNFDRVKDPATVALGAGPDIGPYDHAEVVDPHTVRIVLATPFEPLLINLSKTTLGIVSPAAARRLGDAFQINPVGTGPFRFVSQQAGTEVRLARNPDYRWGTGEHAGPAYLESLVFKNVPEESTRVAVLQSRQAQAADIIPPQSILTLRSDPDFQLIQRELLNENYSLHLNVNRAPWNDQKLRQAFRLALDLDTIVKTVYLGTFERAWSPLSPSIFGYDPGLENSWRPDPAQAAALFEAAGWKVGAGGIRAKGGTRLTVVLVDGQSNREKRLDVITMVREQLRKVGVELRVDSQPGGSYLQRIQRGEYDLLGASLFAPDPDVLRRLYSPVEGSFRMSRADDPDLNKWVVDGYGEADPDRRREIYARIQRRIVDQVYAIPVYVLPYTIGAVREAHGIAIDVHGFPLFADAWIAR